MTTLGKPQAVTSFNITNKRRDRVDINGSRFVTCKTHDNSNIGMVPFACQRERTVNVDTDSGRHFQ
ncbi:hypothetical protein D3C75_496490 [compost metagenome]